MGDGRTLVFAAVAALLTGLLTGLAPAVQALRLNLAADLKAGARAGTYHRSRTRVGLLVVQGALSVVLLVGAVSYLGAHVLGRHLIRAKAPDSAGASEL